MNIFKVLADGDGRILEPNVSAFLAFLLDPKQAHGLDSIFLERVLSAALKEHPDKAKIAPLQSMVGGGIVSLALKSAYEIEVDTEVKVDGRDIDIVIGLKREYEEGERTKGNGNEEFVHAFAIENKIKDSAIDNTQLIEEYEGLLKKYNTAGTIPSTGVTMIFITRSFSKPANDAFNDFRRALGQSRNACHFVWNPVDKNASEIRDFTIYDHMAAILQMDQQGEVDPIHEHTKYIMKSFMSFVKSDFKSYQDEPSIS